MSRGDGGGIAEKVQLGGGTEMLHTEHEHVPGWYGAGTWCGDEGSRFASVFTDDVGKEGCTQRIAHGVDEFCKDPRLSIPFFFYTWGCCVS